MNKISGPWLRTDTENDYLELLTEGETSQRKLRELKRELKKPYGATRSLKEAEREILRAKKEGR